MAGYVVLCFVYPYTRLIYGAANVPNRQLARVHAARFEAVYVSIWIVPGTLVDED